MAEIINLHNLEDPEGDYLKFVGDLSEGVSQAIFLLEKEDGQYTFGCSFTDAKDVVFAIHKLQALAQEIVRQEE